MRIRPFWIVFVLTLYIPFEEAILNWVPVPDKVYLLLRLVGEITLYALLILVVLQKVHVGKKLTKTPIDLLVILFILLAIISIVINKNPLIDSFRSLRVLLRYLALYYVIVNINITKHQVTLLLKAILAIGLLQGILMLGQHFSSEFNSLFALSSRVIDAEIAGQTKEFIKPKVGAVTGTFGSPAGMALFLLISLTVLYTYSYRKSGQMIPAPQYLLGILVITWGIFITYKRAALFLAIMLPVLVLYYGGRKLQLRATILLYIFILSLAGVLLVAIGTDLSVDPHKLTAEKLRLESVPPKEFLIQPFTSDYWENTSEYSRGWFMREATQTVLGSGKLLVGYGPGEQAAREALAKVNPSEFQRLLIPDYYPGFEDTLWIALLIYYGIVGLILFLLILFRLYRVSVWLIKYSLEDEYRLLGITFCVVTIWSIVYTFIERLYVLRPFSFYFWLLAGLVIHSYLLHRHYLPLRYPAK